MKTMEYLIKKYPKGYEDWEEEYKVSHEGETADPIIMEETLV
jgi:hypothetical protein